MSYPSLPLQQWRASFMHIKRLAIFGIAGLVLWGGVWAAHGTVEEAHIGSAYVAKLTCSCLFVSHRPMQSCQSDFDAVAIRPLTTEVAGQSVTVSALGHLISARAVFEPGFGCHLVN
jgi:hypothetical protein